MKAMTFALLGVLAGAVPAQAADLWGLEAFNDVCPISFTDRRSPAGPLAIRHHAESCVGGLSNITGWSAEAEGSSYLFYDHAGQILGRVDATGQGRYEGIFGDGVPLAMGFIGTQGTGAADTPPAGSGQGEAQRCRVYLGSRVCAEPYDIGIPDGSEMMPLARMNVRFSDGLNSQIVARVDRGACLAVTRCRDESFARERTWCEIQLEGRTGWVLKQDETVVYTRNSCD